MRTPGWWVRFWHSRRTRGHKLHWQVFRDLFSIQILKYFVVWFSIVPIAVYVLQGVPENVRIFVTSDQPISFTLGLPFNWVVLWLASLAYTAALVIYKVFCPTLISRYHNFGE